MQARKISLVSLMLVAGFAITVHAEAGKKPAPKPKPKSAKVTAVLILASQTEAKPDARLSSIEEKLRKIFKFEHYQHKGEGQTTVKVPGNSTVTLGQGNRIELGAKPAQKADRIRAHIRWMNGKSVVVDTSVALRKGVPALLGGAKSEAGTLIVAVTYQ